MKNAMVITTLGSVSLVNLETQALETLQDAVGGYVQAIDLDNNQMTMWCNEEGKMIGLPHNPFGQMFWEKMYDRTDYIVGDIVLTGGADDEGETIGLTDEQITEIMKVVASVNDFIQPKITVVY